MSDPLVPPEVDLRDFAFMPVDIVRLFGSEFHAQSDDAAWRAGVTLWLKSYHQVPAASVPDDDIALARLAEFGRDVKAWRRLKDAALRGWVKCSDGRLYHPVVAEKALEGWIEKIGQRKASAAGNAKRYKQEFDPSAFDRQIDECIGRLAALNPQSRSLTKWRNRQSRPSPIALPSGDGRDSQAPPVEIAREPKGQGQGSNLDSSLRSLSVEPETGLDESGADGGEVEEIRAKRSPAADRELILDLVDIWNTEAAVLGLPQVRDITQQRIAALRARIKDFPTYGFTEPREGFRELMAKIRGSPFLTNRTGTGFRADFDFVTKSSKFNKIMEGSYEAAQPSRQSGFGR